MRGKIQHGCGDPANVDHIDPGGAQPLAEGVRQVATGQAAIPANHHRTDLAGQRLTADGLANQAGAVLGQGFADDSADIIGFEYFIGDFLHDRDLIIHSNGGCARHTYRFEAASC